MLKIFKVKNYKNFKDELILDFSDKKDYKFNQYAVKNNMINTMVIYGKNATGKSNLGLAIFDITLHLVDKQQINDQINNYLNADSVEGYASFSYTFDFNGEIITYSYKKTAAKSLLYEELFINGNKIFAYNFKNSKIDKGDLELIGAQDYNYKFPKNDKSILRYISAFPGQEQNKYIGCLMKFVNNMLWFRSVQDRSYIGFKSGTDFIMEKIIKAGYVNKFDKFLKKAGMDYKLSVGKDATGKESLLSNHENRPLSFWEIASSGTRSLTLYFYWSMGFEKASFLFVDEFDAFYHYELAQSILEDISSKAKVQVIFTTHNTTLLNNDILRPDCYYIINNSKLTSLPKLTERELREAHNLEKLFKQGEFVG